MGVRMNKWIVLIVYMIVINIIGFTCMGMDKKKAKRGAWRIPEKRLFLIAIIGGSIGAISGMYFYRHKTKHMTFVIGMPLIFILQIAVIFYVFI